MSVSSKKVRGELDVDLQALMDRADTIEYRIEILLIQLLRELKKKR